MGLRKEKLEALDLKEIRITDAFWGKYTKLVKSVILPYQWRILNDQVEDAEPSHCLANFRIAAGEAQGEFQGAVFQDTDVAKWLEAVGYALSLERDPALEQLADETIALIGRAQQPDGYLNTYFTIREPDGRWKNLREGHELYTAGHMIEAAVAYYEATGKTAFLEIVSRFADLIAEVFGPGEGQIHGYPGHQEIELALVRLYHATGKRKYLELAKYFIETRGTGENYFLLEAQRPDYRQIFPEFAGYTPDYSQSQCPVREQTVATGHAVRAVYMYCAMADLAYEYQDASLLEACRVLWRDVTGRQMYITGGIGASGLLERFTTDYDLPNDCNYSETCASIGLALFGKRMMQISGEASYIDTVERALYNNMLDGIALDGKSFFYVNPLEVRPQNCMERTYREHVKPVRQKWFGVACCPPNIARTLASLGQYVYAKSADTLYMNLFLSNQTGTELAGSRLSLTVDTGYPFNGSVRIHAEGAKEGQKLALRMPGHASGFQLSVNGEKRALTDFETENGYLLLPLAAGIREIVWEMEIPAHFVRANPRVAADAGRIALAKGPLVYCLEQEDNGTELHTIQVSAESEIREFYREDLLGGTLMLQLKGRRLRADAWGEDELYGIHAPEYEPCTIRAIPYCYWCNRTPGEMLVWIREA